MRLPPWVFVVLAAAIGLGLGGAVRYGFYSPAAPQSEREIASDEAKSEPEAGQAPAIIDAQRPLFELPDRDGDTRSIAEFDNQVVLLNFWATWCPPCLEEVPALDALHDELASKGLRVVGIALEDRAAMTAFAREHSVDYTLLAGGREAFDIATEYGNARGTLPYTVVIDRQGIVRATHLGALTQKEARELVQPWL